MLRLLTPLLVLCFSFPAFANEPAAPVTQAEPVGLSPIVFYSGIAVTVGSTVGALGAGVMSALATEEQNQLVSERTVDGQALASNLEKIRQSEQALYALGATAIITGLVTWFIIKPLTLWGSEKAKAAE